MRRNLWVAAGALISFAFLGLLYFGNQRWGSLTSELTTCIDRKLNIQREIDNLRAEIAQLKSSQEIAELKARIDSNSKETCPVCPPCPQCKVCRECKEDGINVRPPCWKNTPLYRPGYNCEGCWENSMSIHWPWSHPADLCNYISLGGCCRYRHLLGLGFDLSPQLGLADMMMLDFAFTSRPHLKNIVEFGALVGVTSHYLALMAHLREGKFTTFDISEHRHEICRNAWYPEHMEYVMVDLLSLPPNEKIIKAVSQAETMYFFDNGDKTTECNRFLQYFAKHDGMLCTHDWDIEVSLEGIRATLEQHGWEPFAFEHSEMLGTHVRCFTKKK